MSEYEEEFNEEPGTTGGRAAAKEGQLTYKQIQQEAYNVQQQAGQAGRIDGEQDPKQFSLKILEGEDVLNKEDVESLDPGEAPTYTGPETPTGWSIIGKDDYGEGSQSKFIHKKSEETEEKLQLIAEQKPELPKIVEVGKGDEKTIISLEIKVQPQEHEGAKQEEIIFSPEVNEAGDKLELILISKTDKDGNVITPDRIEMVKIDGKNMFVLKDLVQNDLQSAFEKIFGKLQKRLDKFEKDKFNFTDEFITVENHAEYKRLQNEAQAINSITQNKNSKFNIARMALISRQDENEKIVDAFDLSLKEWQANIDVAETDYNTKKDAFENAITKFLSQLSGWGKDFEGAISRNNVATIGANKNFSMWQKGIEKYNQGLLLWDKDRIVYNKAIEKYNSGITQTTVPGVNALANEVDIYNAGKHKWGPVTQESEQIWTDPHTGLRLDPIKSNIKVDDKGEITFGHLFLSKTQNPDDVAAYKILRDSKKDDVPFFLFRGTQPQSLEFPGLEPLEVNDKGIGPKSQESFWFKGWKHESGVVPEFIPGIGGRAFNLPLISDTMISSLDTRIAAGEFEGGLGGVRRAVHEFSAHSLTGIETMVPGREEIPDAWSGMVASGWGIAAGIVSLLPGGTEVGRAQAKSVFGILPGVPVGLQRWHRPASLEAFAPRDLTILGMPLGIASEMEYYHKRHPAAFIGSLASEALIGFALKGAGKVIPLGSGLMGLARGVSFVMRLPAKVVPRKAKTAGKVVALIPWIAAREGAALGVTVMGKAAPVITKAAQGVPILQPIMKKIPSAVGIRRTPISGESIGDGLLKIAERIKINRAKKITEKANLEDVKAGRAKKVGESMGDKWVDPVTGEKVGLSLFSNIKVVGRETRFGAQWFGVKPWGKPKIVKTKVFTTPDSVPNIIKDIMAKKILINEKMATPTQKKILMEWRDQSKITGEIAEEMSGNLSQLSKSELDELSKLHGAGKYGALGLNAHPGDLIQDIVKGTIKKLDDIGKVPKGMEKYLPKGQAKKLNTASKAVKQIEEEGLTKIIPQLKKQEVLFRVTPGQQKIMEEQFHAYAMKGKRGRVQVVNQEGLTLDVWEIKHGIHERMLSFGLGDFRFKDVGLIGSQIPGRQFLANLSNQKQLIQTIRHSGRRVGKKGFMSLEDQGNIIDLIRPLLDPSRKFHQRYHVIGAKQQKSVAEQFAGREGVGPMDEVRYLQPGERPTAATLGPFKDELSGLDLSVKARKFIKESQKKQKKIQDEMKMATERRKISGERRYEARRQKDFEDAWKNWEGKLDIEKRNENLAKAELKRIESGTKQDLSESELVSKLAKEVTEVDFAGDSLYSFWKPGGFMWRRTTKYSQRPSSSVFKGFKDNFTRKGKDDGFDKYLADITGANKNANKKDLKNLRKLYKDKQSLKKNKSSIETKTKHDSITKEIEDAERKFRAEAYHKESGKSSDHAQKQIDFTKHTAVEGVGASGDNLGGLAFDMDKYGNKMVKSALDSNFVKNQRMGDGITLDKRGHTQILDDGISKSAQITQLLDDKRLIHNLTGHIHKDHHNFLVNTNPFNIGTDLFLSSKSRSSTGLLFNQLALGTRALARQDQTSYQNLEQVQKLNIIHALNLTTNTDQSLDQENRLRTIMDTTQITENDFMKNLRLKSPVLVTVQSTKLDTDQERARLKLEPESVVTKQVLIEKTTPRVETPFDEIVRTRLPISDTELDSLLSIMPPKLGVEQKQSPQEKLRFKFDYDFGAPTKQEYEQKLRERYQTEYERTRPPPTQRVDEPKLTPFFLPGIPLGSSKITSKTPTPKIFQRQILNPIGELKIVDKDQMKIFQADRHKLHDMAYKTGKKGLNLI